jgi:signal transduction histidine kinase
VYGRKGSIYCVNSITGKSELFYYECIGKANEISNICIQKNHPFLFTRFGEMYALDRNIKKAVLKELNLRHQLSLVWDAKTDRSQNIWIAGYNGLMKMDTAFNITHVDMGKNLITNNIFSLCISPISEMVFLNGPNVIVKPKEIKKTDKPIKILIEEFEAVNTDSIDFKSNSVVLNHLSNSFYVKFSALEYYFPEQIEYSYQLEGYDNAPIFSRTNNIINYASIPPGDYVLVIKAFQKNNELRKGELRFHISIVPAIYQRLWFKILAIVFIFLLIFAAYYAIRVQRLKNKLAKLEKEKELSDVRRKISDDIHDEIGSGLTLISLQGQAAIRNLNKNTDSTKENIDKMVVNARKLTGSLSEIIWTVSPKNDSIRGFVAFVRNYLSECFELLDVKYTFKGPDDVDEIVMNAEVRRNLFLIIKEAVNNTLKHGDASCVDISFNPLPSGNFTLEVCDNGKGIDLNKVTLLGNGLASMKNRAERMNCEFAIESKPGNGTKIILKGSLI